MHIRQVTRLIRARRCDLGGTGERSEKENDSPFVDAVAAIPHIRY